MLKIKNVNDLTSVLNEVYACGYITFKINNTSVEVFFDTQAKGYILFDNCEWCFKTLAHVKNYIIYTYNLK